MLPDGRGLPYSTLDEFVIHAWMGALQASGLGLPAVPGEAAIRAAVAAKLRG